MACEKFRRDKSNVLFLDSYFTSKYVHMKIIYFFFMHVGVATSHVRGLYWLRHHACKDIGKDCESDNIC